MVICRQQATVVTGAVSILLSQLIGSSNNPLNQTFRGLSIQLGFNSSVLAQLPPSDGTGINYTPPNRGAPSSTGSGGARNHEGPTILQSDEDSIQLRGNQNIPPVSPASPVPIQPLRRECSQILPVFLVPQDHAGQTTSSRPKFFWYMSDTSSVEFTLKKEGANEPFFKERLEVPKAGIIQTEIPKGQPELTVGQDYLWSVSVVCNTERGSKKVTVQALIRRVAPTEELTRRLRRAQSERDRARIYAQQGFWYDALETISKASNDKPQDRSITEDFYSLLDQVGLNEVVAKQRQNSQR
ncbi:DUF928 domain-containing protein [Argonema galeatum]|uniref:DUF928 domain-containing protein n=1 Tax=Argonema galeatum TaxID=2942762 RepID=UPI0020112854|nr:DUF928 domain-containing protein [Argonema galeatum]MCL1468197.1 DUF928 domain-containing protein [Argonema galeatum A003/A1]